MSCHVVISLLMFPISVYLTRGCYVAGVGQFRHIVSRTKFSPVVNDKQTINIPADSNPELAD